MHLKQWHYVETTSSGQPVLRENEKDIYVEHPVACYQGKSKILGKQKGRVYLTSQRIIYIDDEAPALQSVALELDDVDSVEYSSKFLRKSARLILFLKDALENEGSKTRHSEDRSVKKYRWTCPICEALNESTGYPSSDGTSLIPCENCGITPDFDMIENSITAVVDTSAQPASIACSACTYLNPIALRNCEMCGNRLPVKEGALGMPSPPDKRVKIDLESKDGLSEDSRIFVQLSFRMSDGVLFSQTISELLVTQERAKVEKVYNKGAKLLNGSDIKPSNFNTIFDSDSKLNRVGISSLEKSQENKLIHNDIMLNNALSDLSSLMALASDIERLYNNMDKPEQQKASPILTVDREKFLTKELFIEEISRELHGFIMAEFQEQKQKEGVILITLVDIYALYNKAMRIGSGLVSPQELREACEKFEKIGLTDLQLTRINGRVLCVSSGDSFGFIKQKILDITATTPGADLLQLSKTLNDSYANSWTVGIIMEALNNCVNEGKLLIDEQVTGIHYYLNFDWKI